MLAAVGAYLRRLRDRKGWSRAEVIRAAKRQFDVTIGDTTIKHIEDGDSNSGGATLAILTHVLGGDVRHLGGLLLAPDAPAEDGAALADALIAAMVEQGETPEEAALAVLLAAYDDAVTRRDLVAQRLALTALAAHYRGGSDTPPFDE